METGPGSVQPPGGSFEARNAPATPDAPQESVLDRLVRAALEVLTDLPATRLVEAVGVREIARRAGTSTRAVYHHFGDLQGLTDAVLDRVFDPATHERGLPSAVEVGPGRTELAQTLERYRASLTHLAEDPDFGVRFGMWAIGDAPLQQRYAAWLLALEDALFADPHAIPSRDVLEPRPPLDHRGFVAAYAGIRHGMAIRQLLDPHPDRADQFAMAYVALVAALSRQAGDTHDADTRLAEMNHFPLDRRRQPATLESPERSARRARLLDAAEPLLQAQGFDQVTIETVAEQAGLTAAVVLDLVESKHDLAVAVVRRRIDALPLRQVTGRDDLRAALLDLAAVAGSARAYLLPYALDLTRDAPGLAEPLAHRLGPAVAPPQAVGLVVQLAQRVLSTPPESALPSAELLVDHVLGAGTAEDRR